MFFGRVTRRVRNWLGQRNVWAALAALALLGTAGAVFAQGEEPPWHQNLSCDSGFQKYQGLEYCNGLDGRAHVLVVDLHDESGLRIEYIIAEGLDKFGKQGECRDVNIYETVYDQVLTMGPACMDPANIYYYPIMSLEQAVKRYPNVSAVVASDYGAHNEEEPRSREHGPEGLTIVRGDRLDGPGPNGPGDADNNAVRRPWLAISEAAPLRAEFGQLTTDDGSKPYEWIYTGVGGSPWLIREGGIDPKIEDCVNTNSWSCDSAEAQAAVALSQDGRWLYLVVVDGVDAKGIADFIKKNLEPWEAIKFDGGGSAQMWYGGLPGTGFEARELFPNRDRKLSQYLAIIAPPGEGIELEPPEALTPLPMIDEGWWDGLWTSIEQQLVETWSSIGQDLSRLWREFRTNAERRFAEWWQTAQEELTRQIIAELERMIGQLCGSVATLLTVTFAGVAWMSHHRKR